MLVWYDYFVSRAFAASEVRRICDTGEDREEKATRTAIEEERVVHVFFTKSHVAHGPAIPPTSNDQPTRNEEGTLRWRTLEQQVERRRKREATEQRA